MRGMVSYPVLHYSLYHCRKDELPYVAFVEHDVVAFHLVIRSELH